MLTISVTTATIYNECFASFYSLQCNYANARPVFFVQFMCLNVYLFRQAKVLLKAEMDYVKHKMNHGDLSVQAYTAGVGRMLLAGPFLTITKQIHSGKSCKQEGQNWVIGEEAWGKVKINQRNDYFFIGCYHIDGSGF